MRDTADRTDLGELVRSPLGELGRRNTPFTLAVQQLANTNIWLGMPRCWMAFVQWLGLSGPPPAPAGIQNNQLQSIYLPPPSWRTQFRRRFASWYISWNGNPFVTSGSGNEYFSGPGDAVTYNGDLPKLSYSSLQYANTLPVGANNRSNIQWNSGGWNGWEYGDSYKDASGNTCLVNANGDKPFSSALSISVQRLMSRQWQNFRYAGPYPVGDYFGEIRSEFFENSTGGWNQTNLQALPYFGANEINGTAGADGIWSGWIYDTNEWEEQMGGASAMSGDGADGRVYAQRSRFQVTKSTPYFIAQAIVTRMPKWNDLPPLGSIPLRDNLAEVTLVSKGTASAGQIVEVPYPSTAKGSTDFVTTSLPVNGLQTLSVGCINFVNLGETVGDFQSRTGIAIGGA